MTVPQTKPQEQGDAAEFDAFADQYDAGMDNPLKRIAGDNPAVFIELKVRWLMRDWSGVTNPRVIDIGCGAGLFLRVLKRMGFEADLSGCDISPGMLQEAAKQWAEEFGDQPKPSYEGIAGGKLPYPDNSADIAILCAVLHHIEPEDRPNTYAEACRVLKPGGWLYIFEHNPYNPVTQHVVKTTPIDENAILLTAGEAIASCRAAGMAIQKKQYIMFLPPKLRSVEQIERLMTWLPLGGQYVVTAQPAE